MPRFDGTGPNGMGPMTGGGRGFCWPWGAGMRSYAFPRWSHYNYQRGFRPFIPGMSRDQELEFLKGQAKTFRDELKQLETEISKLSAEKK